MLALSASSEQSSTQVDLIENDPLKVLGLGLDATEDDIKQAYKLLSLRCHPDKNPEDVNAKENFQHISAAYELLMDSKIREALPKIRRALLTYSRSPQPEAFMAVYTAVFDSAYDRDGGKLEGILRSEVWHSVERLADCLRTPLCEPHQAWMKRVISEMYQVRNYLYCLQAGFAHAGRYRDFDVTMLSALAAAQQDVGMNELSHSFWCTIGKVVDKDAECALMLGDLVAIWSRCGCPIAALRVDVSPDNQQVYDAMRAAFAARNAKLLSPALLSKTVDPNRNRRIFFHIHNAPLMTIVAGFISDDDLNKVFCTHRARRTLSLSARDSVLALDAVEHVPAHDSVPALGSGPACFSSLRHCCLM